MDKIHITVPIVVEGRYDKAKLANLTDAMIIPTNGFGIFKNAEKTALLRRLGKNGIILLCDSDGAGGVIRSHLKGSLNGIRTYNLYTAQIKGKEARKASPSKEGYLGVEGISDSALRELLLKLVAAHPELGGEANEPLPSQNEITKADLFHLKLTGYPDSTSRRNKLCLSLGLPKDMTPNAMLAALNMISSLEEISSKLDQE
jgi:ribonuclease M5